VETIVACGSDAVRGIQLIFFECLWLW